MKKNFLTFIAVLFSLQIFSQSLVYENTYIKAHNIQAYDDYIENVFSNVHQQRIDAGIIVGWDVWKVVDNPQEGFTHIFTTVYEVDNQKSIDEFIPKRPENMSERDWNLRSKDLREIREIVGVVKYMGLAQIRKKGVEQVPDYMAFNVLKLKNEKWKSYEDSEINGTKNIGAKDLRVGWDFARRIDDYGTDISHTHITVDWYKSHADFLKSFMGTNISDASKAYQGMLKLRDLKYRVLLKKHKSLR
jgi:hypothetical protein